MEEEWKKKERTSDHALHASNVPCSNVCIKITLAVKDP